MTLYSVTAGMLVQDEAAESRDITEGEAIEAVAESTGHDSEAHPPLLEDENTWVLVGFLIVIGILLWQNVPKLAGRILGRRAEQVRQQLDEARTLREDAQRLLADFQKQQRDAETEAQGIIDQARKDAKLMSEEARVKLDEQLGRRREAAEERIARAEAQAIAAVRSETADLAVAAAQEIIANRMDKRAQAALIDKAISKVGTQLQ